MDETVRIPPHGRNCRECDAPLIWAHTWKKGMLNEKASPYDCTPSDDGNTRIVVTGGHEYQARVLSGEELQWAQKQGEQLYKSHFVTCPASEKFRTKKAAVQ